VELKEIRTLIDLMKKNGLTVFKMERDGFKITLKSGHDASGSPVIHHTVTAPAQVAQAAAAPAEAKPAIDPNLKEIKSPMVGTFYASPSPESPAFVEAGTPVGAETVVCIIEAMKVMNEIKAEITGTVVEVCVENGKPVQFGQVLFRVK